MNFLLGFLQKYNSPLMIKNRTLEFKQRYSSQPKRPPPQNFTPGSINNNFQITGFTDFSVSTSANKTSNRKLAKVESTSFINSRKKLSEFCLQAQTYSGQYIDNSTNLCQYMKVATKKIDKTSILKYRMAPNEDAGSQKATVESPKFETSHSTKAPRNQIMIKAIRDINNFFNSLTPRSLFFCCRCFKYIFAIEKSLHYPKCENEVNVEDLNPMEIQEIGWQRLQLIQELAEYTKFKFEEIRQLHRRMKQKKLQEDIVIAMGVEYLAFEGIVEAFYLVYHLLLWQENGRSSRIFSIRKFLSCVEPYQASGLFQKKFFE